MRKLRNRKGHASMEYILLFGAVVTALGVFLPGKFTESFNSAMGSAADGLTEAAGGFSSGTPEVPIE